MAESPKVIKYKIVTPQDPLNVTLQSKEANENFSRSFSLNFQKRIEQLSVNNLIYVADIFGIRHPKEPDLFRRSPSAKAIVDRCCAVAEREAMVIYSKMNWPKIIESIYVDKELSGLLDEPESKNARRALNIIVSQEFSLSASREKRTNYYFRLKPFHGAVVRAIGDTVKTSLGKLRRGQSEREEKSPDSRELERTILRSAFNAPSFEAIRGRIRYRQIRGEDKLTDRKAVTRERFLEFDSLCSTRANEQPRLKALSDRYGRELRALRRDRGAYRLHLVGIDLETHLRVKATAPPDPDRNPPLDADLLQAIQSLLVAHAGLMSIFPEIVRLSEELDRYRAQHEALDALRDRVLDPALEQLARSQGIFDDETKKLTKEISELDAQSLAMEAAPTRAVVATKHGWLRGALAAIGRYVLGQAKSITKTVRDTAIKEAVSQALKDPRNLFITVLSFFVAAQEALLRLSESLPISFGWIIHLLKWLGIG